MRLEAKEKIDGHRILAVRNALRRCGWWFDANDLASLLKISLVAANRLITELTSRGWCAPVDRGGYELTSEGMRFLSATASRPINRETAQSHLETVVERATIFDRSFPWWPAQLEQIAVFGSYLTDSEKLGDLDLALKFVRRPAMMSPATINRARDAAEESGFHCRSLVERAGGFISLFIIHQLGAQLRSVSFHDWSDLEQLTCKHEVIWTCPVTSELRANFESGL